MAKRCNAPGCGQNALTLMGRNQPPTGEPSTEWDFGLPNAPGPYQINSINGSLIETAGGLAPFNFEYTGGSLPGGMAVADVPPYGWTVGGLINSSGTFNFEITGTDANGIVVIKHFTMEVICGSISNPGLPKGFVGVPYEYDVNIVSNIDAIDFDDMPIIPGLTWQLIDPHTLRLSGTPTDAGTYQNGVTGLIYMENGWCSIPFWPGVKIL